MKTQQEAAEQAIREFSFDNYGMNDVDIALHDDPEAQEWVPALARAVLEAVGKASRWQPIDMRGQLVEEPPSGGQQ
jgi:hypothetical protein